MATKILVIKIGWPKFKKKNENRRIKTAFKIFFIYRYRQQQVIENSNTHNRGIGIRTLIIASNQVISTFLPIEIKIYEHYSSL
jgi:hypothetical protein